MWSGRAAAALSLAAAALLLLSSLQESSLRPTPLAVRRPLPAPLERDEGRRAAHHDQPAAHGHEPASVSDGAVTDTARDDVRQREMKLDGRDAPDRGQPLGASETHSEADNLLQRSDVTTNSSRPLVVVSTKKDTSGAVETRALYAAGHAWPAAAVCPALGARMRLLVLVTSAPAHAAARAAARLTWGNHNARSDVGLAFFIGRPAGALLPALAAERDLYGDLIMGNFLDSYKNLTLKTVSMLEWTATYCPHVPRILKTDDDMFINIPRLLEFLDARVNDTKTIWGRVVRRWLPNRNPNSKYYLPKKQYPGKTLPAFATGPAYVVTQDAVRPLWDAALRPGAAFLYLEDVALTGLAAQHAHIRLVNAGEFVNKHVRPSACALRKLISVHMVSLELQLDLWRALHAGKCKG